MALEDLMVVEREETDRALHLESQEVEAEERPIFVLAQIRCMLELL